MAILDSFRPWTGQINRRTGQTDRTGDIFGPTSSTDGAIMMDNHDRHTAGEDRWIGRIKLLTEHDEAWLILVK